MDYAAAVSRNMVKPGAFNTFTQRSHTFIDKLQRPRSIRFTFSRGDIVNAAKFYSALAMQAKASPISMARDSYGNLIVSFRDERTREWVLQLPYLELQNGKQFVIHDSSNVIVNVQVFNVPYELADEAVTRKLQR